jgi:hypothetical protein
VVTDTQVNAGVPCILKAVVKKAQNLRVDHRNGRRGK